MGAVEEPELLFRLESVSKRGEDDCLLREVVLSIPAEQVTVLVGPSGAGKTTLLRLLNRLQEPDEGQILFRGRPLESYPVGELRREVGFLFQTPVMFPGTVRRNLREAAEIAGIDTSRFVESAR